MNKFRKERFINQRFSERTKTWSFQVRIKDEDICKTFKAEDYGSPRAAYQNAINFRNQALLDVQKGVLYCKANTTLDDVFDEVFDLFPMRQETRRKYEIYYGKYIQDNILIKNVTRAYILGQLNTMILDCSDDTINRVLSIWRKICKTAIIKEYISIDPTLSITAPKSQKIKKDKKDVRISRDELDEVKENINKRFIKESKQVNMALEVMWYCGLRPCECFALSKSDIKDGYIDVYKELGSDMVTQANKRATVVRKSKTDASIRKVPIPKKLQDLLDDYKVSGEILFPTENGDYFNVTNLCGRLYGLGLDFRMYKLRHAVASKLVKNKVDQRTIVEILGHENFDMSVYYARSDEETKKEALELEENKKIE